MLEIALEAEVLKLKKEREIMEKKIQEILKTHLKWLRDEEGGERANLGGADLRSANLGGADLRSANLRSANLGDANLYGANLGGANLGGANLGGADLRSANLRSADLRSANLRSANLYGATLYGANLDGANLGGANLYDANLGGADLRSANLYGATLYGANLDGANLDGAKNLFYRPDLEIIKHCTGKIRAWKYVKADGSNPYNQFSEKYEVGKTYNAIENNFDEHQNCGTGFNVATLCWCYHDSKNTKNQYLEIEFTAKDIVAIPYTTDGKFRVKKMKILRRITRKEAEELLKIEKGAHK